MDEQPSLHYRSAARYSLAIIVIVVLLGILGWAIYRHAHRANSSHTSKPSTSQATTKGSSKAQTTTNSGSSNPSSQSNNNAQNSATSNTQPQTSSLANTGPGDTIALFVGATILGSVGYYARLRYRISKSD